MNQCHKIQGSCAYAVKSSNKLTMCFFLWGTMFYSQVSRKHKYFCFLFFFFLNKCSEHSVNFISFHPRGTVKNMKCQQLLSNKNATLLFLKAMRLPMQSIQSEQWATMNKSSSRQELCSRNHNSNKRKAEVCLYNFNLSWQLTVLE